MAGSVRWILPLARIAQKVGLGRPLGAPSDRATLATIAIIATVRDCWLEKKWTIKKSPLRLAG
jgi:hypothetical protein